MVHRSASFIALVCGALFFTACGDDAKKGADPTCPQGQILNQVSGQCIPGGSNIDTSDGGTDDDAGGEDDMGGGPDDMGGGGDTDLPDMDPVDMPSDRCQPGVDSDGDGLNDDCECTLTTSPLEADTDGDGLTDGEEDANGNCAFDPADGETDPRRDDTDVDGATDAEEIAAGTDPLNPDMDMDMILDGAELASGCLDPNNADTDMDGLPDGTEDGNLDGMIGMCPNRMFDYACAQGESDPCSNDTDGDGTPDADEAQYRDCRPEDLVGLVTPQMLVNMTADYKLGLDPAITTSAIVAPAAVEGHGFEDTANGFTGFIASFAPAGGETLPNRVSDQVVTAIQGIYPTATRRASGRQITTHDSYKATVRAIVDLPAGTAPDAARDAILGQLAGVPAASVNTGLGGTFAGDAQETLFVYEIVARSASQYIIVGAAVTLTDYDNDAAQGGIRIDDITGGGAVGGAMDNLSDDCVAYTVTARPKVDIIISIDGSGSMNEEQTALQNFATDFTSLLTASNLDWRTAVTLPACGGDTNLSPEAKALFANAGCGLPTIPFPIPGFPGATDTGELVGGDFTSDPMELRTRLDPGIFNASAGEHTASALTAAADLALPRSDTDPSKFRTDAAVVLIAITDEEDAYFQDTLSFGQIDNSSLTPAQAMEIDTATDPWVQFLLQPELGATMFGVVWPTGEACPNDNSYAAAHAITQIVNETGGLTGSICQTDYTNTLRVIAEATAGISSGLRVRGVPLPPTVEVTHGSAQTGNVVDMPRSRVDGFDFDSIVNRVSFTGPNPPQTNDRVIIPYRRWENSVFMCMSTAECPAEQKLKCVDGECR